MRPSAPILQNLRLECLLSRFLPRVTHIQGIFLARLLGPNCCNLDRYFAEMVWYSTIAPDGITGPLNGIPNHLSYGDFSTRQEILNISQIIVIFPWNPPTIRYPDLIATAPQTSLLSLYALHFWKSHLFPDLCGVDVQWFQDTASQDLPNSCKWLLASSSAPATSVSSSWSPGKFLFCTGRTVTTGLPSLVPPRRIDDWCVIHFLHWELCDPQSLNHQNFPLWARLYQHVFCKKPLLLFVFKQISQFRSFGKCVFVHYAFLSLVPLLLATPLLSSWEELGSVSTSLDAGFPRGSEGLLSSTKCSQNSCSQPGNSCDVSLCSSSRPSFLFLFSFSVDSCCGFLGSSSLVLPLLSGSGFSVYLLGVKYRILWWRWWRSRCGRCTGTRW